MVKLRRNAKRNIIACDFETGFTDETKTARHVTMAGFCVVNNDDKSENVYRSFSLDEFFESLNKKFANSMKKNVLFFHNLDYDSSYIESWALKKSIVFTETRNFKTKVIYKLSIVYKQVKYDIYDSLKYFPNQSIASLGNMIGIKKLKDIFDYDKNRNDCLDISILDLVYFDRDIITLKRILEDHFKEHSRLRLTRPSYAFASLKNQVYQDDRKRESDDNYYNELFKPIISDDHYNILRRAYFGGFTYANPKFTSKNLGKGFVFDVNSLYPSVMVTNFPCLSSQEIFTKKEFNYVVKNDLLNVKDFYAIIEVEITSLKLKKDHFPSLPKKMNFRSNEVITNFEDLGEYKFVTLTNIDFYWLLENYHVTYNFSQGFYYPKFMKEPFKNFIDKNNKVKVEAKAKGETVKALMAKLTNNSSYGKFGQNPDFEDSEAFLDSDDVVGFVRKKSSVKKKYKNNILIADFVTAKARNVLYNAIRAVNQSKYFDFVYCDTDSIHILNYTDLKAQDYKEVQKLLPIEIDPLRLGAWKLENDFSRARFLRSKLYYEDSVIDGDVLKGAGIDDQGKAYLLKNIHKYGLEFFNFPLVVPAKRKKRIEGGYLIEEYQKRIAEKGQRFKEE